MSKDQQKTTHKMRLPIMALFMTSAIAASAGSGFGLALRLNHPQEPGATILHKWQSFPTRNNWPIVASPSAR
ncbi:hypothetical protein [Oscillatoria salina]|uniref:hypothetical protein n=1 Tax=Oscillatoria salina TaxID=331517 RepID=UPI0013B8D504|nr:hypothetical protein [Oscillatoria salina]MBZ8179079.1 hypothetical protein [Oscillatoria salina IIICB1]NET88815.1 hypothetical protein [Kamptonema sp. SIO1D9]